MRPRILYAISLLALFASFAPAISSPKPDRSRWVLFLANRSGLIDAVDPATLQTLGTIRTGGMTDWVIARPDGASLVIARARANEPNVCCALYSLDLDTAQLHFLIYPAMRGVLSNDGGTLFLQRGNTTIDSIDLRTLTPNLSLGSPGHTYLLQPSPNPRWFFGLTNWPGLTLDIIDRKTGATARSLAIPGKLESTGAWMNGTYYLFTYGKGKATLWNVTTETEKLPAGEPVDLHELGGECRIPHSSASAPLYLQPPVAAAGRLLLYEGFGYKLDRRECAPPPKGGYYVIDPASGAVTAHLASRLHFMHLVADCDGKQLYGVVLGASMSDNRVTLVRLDAATGNILASRELSRDESSGMVAHISLANLLSEYIPRGEVRAAETPARSWAACPLTKPVLDQPPQDPKASPIGFGEWYVNAQRTIWFPRGDWRAGAAEKIILVHTAGAHLSITARRLDGNAPPLHLDGSPSDYPGSLLEVIGMSFPSEGCWEVTAKSASDDELRFVTPVLPALHK